jgi:phosphatidylserine/phosphatidylglycerophosphate/cardiolipin synthase-like enzyme
MNKRDATDNRFYAAAAALFFAFLFIALPVSVYPADLLLNGAAARVLFSPNGGCTSGIIEEISGARRQILVQMFNFTSGPIRDALLTARRRGVNVAVILDNTVQKQNKFRTAHILAQGGVATFMDERHANAHNKVMIIDGETVVTGSFNYTYAAERDNAENVLIIRSSALARPYMDDWLTHQGHSVKY